MPATTHMIRMTIGGSTVRVLSCGAAGAGVNWARLNRATVKGAAVKGAAASRSAAGSAETSAIVAGKAGWGATPSMETGAAGGAVGARFGSLKPQDASVPEKAVQSLGRGPPVCKKVVTNFTRSARAAPVAQIRQLLQNRPTRTIANAATAPPPLDLR